MRRYQTVSMMDISMIQCILKVLFRVTQYKVVFFTRGVRGCNFES